MRFLKGGVRFLFVTVGIVILTSFTIDATDTLRTSQTALSVLTGNVLEEGCVEGTVRIDLANKSICMDIYENGVSEACAVAKPSFDSETKLNIDRKACTSISQKGVQPWTFVTLHQAKALCAKRGMRLPSTLEWYEAGLGTPDSTDCNTEGGGVRIAGNYNECVSSRGVYDMIGNVWEWVDAEVVDGEYNGRKLPESGYVSEVDNAGVVITSSDNASDMYNKDYFYVDGTGVRGMLRGGYYAGETDTGLFSIHTKITPSFSSNGTGFRCVKTI